MPRASMAVIVVALCLAIGLAPSCGCAEDVLTLDDGTTIRGTLVGYDSAAAAYVVRIGRLVKHVPEARVRAFTDTAASTSTPDDDDRARLLAEQRAAFADLSTSRLSRVHRPDSSTSGDKRFSFDEPSTSAIGFAGPAPRNLQGRSGLLPGLGTPPPELKEVLDLSTKLQSESPFFRTMVERQTTGGAGTIDSSALSSISPADGQELMNNASLQQLTERFRDPAYQRALLEQLRRAGEKSDGAKNADHERRLQMIESLFGQLRSMQGER